MQKKTAYKRIDKTLESIERARKEQNHCKAKIIEAPLKFRGIELELENRFWNTRLGQLEAAEQNALRRLSQLRDECNGQLEFQLV